MPGKAHAPPTLTIGLCPLLLSSSAATEDQIEPEELADLGPRDLSYWVASFFSDVKMLQQNVSSIWRLKCGFVGDACILLVGVVSPSNVSPGVLKLEGLEGGGVCATAERGKREGHFPV